MSDSNAGASVTFKTLDQYGSEMATAATIPTTPTVTATSTNVGAATVTVAGAAAGAATITSAAAAYTSGDSYTFKIHESEVLVTITQGGTAASGGTAGTVVASIEVK